MGSSAGKTKGKGVLGAWGGGVGGQPAGSIRARACDTMQRCMKLAGVALALPTTGQALMRHSLPPPLPPLTPTPTLACAAICYIYSPVPSLPLPAMRRSRPCPASLNPSNAAIQCSLCHKQRSHPGSTAGRAPISSESPSLHPRARPPPHLGEPGVLHHLRQRQPPAGVHHQHPLQQVAARVAHSGPLGQHPVALRMGQGWARGWTWRGRD